MLHQINARRDNKRAELEELQAAGTASKEDEERLTHAADASDKEAELLAADLALLREFASSQSVTIKDEATGSTQLIEAQ